MSSGPENTSAASQDVLQLLDGIRAHCGKLSVAKKESIRLTTLCDELTKRIKGSPLTPQGSNHGNVEWVEKQLAQWSKWGFIWSWLRKSKIKRGITECIQRLNHVPGPPGDGSGNAGTGERPRQKIQFEPTLPAGRLALDPRELPSVKRLNGKVIRKGDIAFAGGVHCEVWEGLLDREEVDGKKIDAEKVALKALKTPRSSEGARKRLYAELPKWVELNHNNILPLYGIVTNLGPRVLMVSPWQENGNLLIHVRKNPEAKKNRLLCGTAAGLSYLHSQNIVHGSVKCKNVLVSQMGETQICDFGISRIIEEGTDSTVSKTVTGEAVRYLALELIETFNAPPTTQSDTYSFAMLVYECVAEKIPFHEHTRDAAVIHMRMAKRQSPPRPDGPAERDRVSDDLWGLMNRCWSPEPSDRPTMENVHSSFLLSR